MWTAIVIIVIVTTIGRVARSKYRGPYTLGDHMRSVQSLAPLPLPAIDPALSSEVADLRKRLEVLERIATEDRKTRELADEIERLR